MSSDSGIEPLRQRVAVVAPAGGVHRGGVDHRFQRFYERHFAEMLRLAAFLSGDRDHAEDLAQDAFVRVYRYTASSDRPIENPAGLLRTTTVNVCRSWHRDRQRHEARLVRHGPDDESVGSWERELDHSLQRLPYEQRAVVVLRYRLGLSESEIAAALGCRSGTVKSRHARAMRTLRKDLT